MHKYSVYGHMVLRPRAVGCKAKRKGSQRQRVPAYEYSDSLCFLWRDHYWPTSTNQLVYNVGWILIWCALRNAHILDNWHDIICQPSEGLVMPSRLHLSREEINSRGTCCIIKYNFYLQYLINIQLACVPPLWSVHPVNLIITFVKY